MKRIKQTIIPLASLMLLAACNSVELNKENIKGTWELTDLYHEIMERDIDNALKALDTMTQVNLGQRAMWQTDDVEIVKQKEREMLVNERQFYKQRFIGATYEFVNDTMVIKRADNFADTNTYRLDKDIIYIKRMGGGPQTKEHEWHVVKLTKENLEIHESFVSDTKVETSFKKIK